MSDNQKLPLLELEALSKHFTVGKQKLTAVNNVSFNVFQGETLGLVGESGCGKSTLGKTLLRLIEPSSGKIFLHGENISELSRKELMSFRRRAQIIFQDPYASLNPRMTVEDIVGEALDIHGLFQGSQRAPRVLKLLQMVGLDRDHMSRYPHEFSGGQRQRIGIARALAVDPEFLVCDEAISALDVSVQAQIVNLLKDLQERLGLTYLFIAHDLSMVKYLSHRVAVMYLGHVVEVAPTQELFQNPKHPYTQMLLGAVPIADPQKERQRQRVVVPGEVPSPLNPPTGCPFRTRCPQAKPTCAQSTPRLHHLGSTRKVACHLYPA